MLSLRLAPATVGLGDGVCRGGPPRSALVRLDRSRRVEEGLHDPPGLLDHLPAREERADLHEAASTRSRSYGPGGSTELLGEVEVQRDGLGDLLAGRLRPDEDRHAGLPPDPEDDVVVAGGVEPVRAPLQLRHALEADDDLRRRPRERLSRADEDRDARPAPVLDLEVAERRTSPCRSPGARPRSPGSRRTDRAPQATDLLPSSRETRRRGGAESHRRHPEGGSIATSARTCRRWFCTTSRTAPTGS